VAAIKEAGLAVRTIIGGAPVTETFADQIGADGYSDDAPGAVELARKLMATLKVEALRDKHNEQSDHQL
jgi:5-methyltetrahydrofolate--homocysteine methyltransferase